MKYEDLPHTKCPECGLLFTPEAHDDLIKNLVDENNQLRKALYDIIKAENGYIGNDYRLAKIARNALGLEDHIKELF